MSLTLTSMGGIENEPPDVGRYRDPEEMRVSLLTSGATRTQGGCAVLNVIGDMGSAHGSFCHIERLDEGPGLEDIPQRFQVGQLQSGPFPAHGQHFS